MNPAIWVAIIGGLFSIGTVLYKSWNRANAVQIAIFAEIGRLVYVLEKHKEWWENKGEHNEDPLIPLATPIFDEHEQDLGDIDSAMVGDVVRFYGAIKYINALQAKRDDFNNKKHFKELYSGVLRNVWGHHGSKFQALLADDRSTDLPKASEPGRGSPARLGRSEEQTAAT